MFTGIVEGLGRIVKVRDVKHLRTLQVRLPKSLARGINKSASVAVDGVCLTVAQKNKDVLTFELMRPTLLNTTFGTRAVGDTVNLERALRVGQELGGHFVFGHVDGIGKVQSVRKAGKSREVTILVDHKLGRYFVPRGSVALNGISLTVVEAKGNTFCVGLIPYTLAHTNLGTLKVGDEVNIEIDMLAKYIEKLLNL
ncbi:riboflavin synthase [Candidatus Uhrbacteria bacterium]|nr:riboflavin synthase [Candidatus Uhrbacteria bacterium]